MTDNRIKIGFEKLYSLLKEEQKIKFPSFEQISSWEKVLSEWLNNNDIPLFVRKPANVRGSFTIHSSNRKIVFTDNTPAHWVYKKVVLDNECPSLSAINQAIKTSVFPYAMIRKKIEKEYLLDAQIASKEFRLGHQNWKLAHIERIALPRRQNISIEEYIQHHKKFLSLKNMYIIRKEFSGLAEVPIFNQIILDKQ